MEYTTERELGSHATALGPVQFAIVVRMRQVNLLEHEFALLREKRSAQQKNSQRNSAAIRRGPDSGEHAFLRVRPNGGHYKGFAERFSAGSAVTSSYRRARKGSAKCEEKLAMNSAT
jgi:hypothetical protein